MSRAQRPAPASGYRRTLVAAVVLIVLPCAFFAPVLFGGRVLLPAEYLAHFTPWSDVLPQRTGVYWNALIWDAMAQYLPWRAFAHRWLAQGVIPLWNPHQFCGTPFVANGQSALFYPLNLLFWLFDPARTFGWAMALHFALAGLFAFAFLRTLGLGRSGALLGGVAFQFCGFFITWAELPTLVNVGIWLPLILLCIERFFQSRRIAYAVAGGGVIGVALLAGHPQMAFYLLLGAGAYFLFRWACDLRDGSGWPGVARGLAGGAVALGVAAALAAVQALPVLEMLPHSHRAGAGNYQWYVKFAVPWRHLVTIALPDFFGRPTTGTYWDWPAGNYAELIAYVGVAPLLLGVLAVFWWRRSPCPRHVWFFAAGAVLALLGAMGGPVNALFFRLVPGFGGTGGPGRMLYLWATFLALLAGMGADALVGRLHRDDRRGLARDALLAAGALVVVTAGLGVAAFLSLPPDRLPPPGLLADIARPSLVILVVVILLWAALLLAAARRALRAGLLAAALLALTVADLFAFGMDYNPTSPPEFVYPETPAITALKQAEPDSRFAALCRSWPIGPDFPRAALPPNAATYYGLFDIAGYDSIYLQRYKDILALLLGHDPSPPANGNMILIDSFPAVAADYLAVRRLVWARPEPSLPSPRREVHVREIPEGSYRAALFTEESTETELLGCIPPALRPRLQMVSPNVARAVLPEPLHSSSALLRVYDTLYPGWRAIVDGRPTGSAGALPGREWGVLYAVMRPSDQSVEFRYEPATFRFGLFVTLCAVGFLAAAFIVWISPKRRPLPLDGEG